MKIGFPSELISPHKNSAEFRSWLSRLGDYIFIRRILLISNLTEVLLNADFARADANQVSKRGNIIFSEDHNFWYVEIRGLKNYVDEIEIVANLIIQAIHAPKTMINFDGFPVKKLSLCLDNYLTKNNLESLETKERLLSDRLISISTINKQMKEQGIDSNIHAFLPLVDFSNAPNINSSEQKNLEAQREKFSKFFITKLFLS